MAYIFFLNLFFLKHDIFSFKTFFLYKFLPLFYLSPLSINLCTGQLGGQTELKKTGKRRKTSIRLETTLCCPPSWYRASDQRILVTIASRARILVDIMHPPKCVPHAANLCARACVCVFGVATTERLWMFVKIQPVSGRYPRRRDWDTGHHYAGGGHV